MAERQDLSVYLDGLGSARAFNTVTVKSRVDGQLVEVHSQEGQEVRKGDVLAVIDPRPFQVALAQAQAALFRNPSPLADAKRNMDRYTQLAKEGVIAQRQSDTQVALVGQLEGALQVDQAQYRKRQTEPGQAASSSQANMSAMSFSAFETVQREESYAI